MADDTIEKTPDDIRRFTLRFPEILGLRVDAACEESDCSLNTWIVESMRLRLDGENSAVPQTYQDKKTTTDKSAVESVTTIYSPVVLEQAAKAESGIGRSVTEFLLSAKPKISVPAGRIENELTIALDDAAERQLGPASRPWLPELLKIQKTYDEDKGSALEDYAYLVRNMKMPPKHRGYTPVSNQKELVARAAWLDEHHPLEGK
jgi:hypothetical protein